MPIQHAIWTVGGSPKPLVPSKLPSEQVLEEMIVKDPRILSSEWMLIGRQEITTYGARIDLLAIAPDGSLVLIELKRDKTPREIVAQALDYASWVEQLTPQKIAQIYHRYSNGGNLDEAFEQRFGAELEEESLNASHQIIIVAAALDESTERIVNYLSDRDVAINVVLFQVFQQGEQQLLSRAWLLDPGETQANVAVSGKSKGDKEPWNGEFYVSYGGRSWEDAVNYGFISGGGGSWYSKTLELLEPGNLVWVKIPKVGYVGVGVVTSSRASVNDFKVQTASGERPVLDVVRDAERYRKGADDPEVAEYFVGVKWLQTVPESKAINEVGLFGNQNTVCKPVAAKWRHTVERLKEYFPKWNSGAT